MKLNTNTGKSIDFKLPTADADNAENRKVKFPITDVQTKPTNTTVVVTCVHKKTIVNIDVEQDMTVKGFTSPDSEAGDELVLCLANDGTPRTVTLSGELMAPGGNVVGTASVTSTVSFVHNGGKFIEVSRSPVVDVDA